MKTYILSIPDEANDPVVRAALADLLVRQLIVLEPDSGDVLPALSLEEFAAELHSALASPTLSAEEARAYLRL